MGYRSQVCFSITKALFDKQIKLRENLKDCDGVKIAEFGTKEKTIVYYFMWSHVKWYDEYEDVAAINQIVNENSEECSLSRIGEEDDDIEFKGNREHDVFLVRDLDIPGKEGDLNKLLAPNSIKLLDKIKTGVKNESKKRR